MRQARQAEPVCRPDATFFALSAAPLENPGEAPAGSATPPPPTGLGEPTSSGAVAVVRVTPADVVPPLGFHAPPKRSFEDLEIPGNYRDVVQKELTQGEQILAGSAIAEPGRPSAQPGATAHWPGPRSRRPSRPVGAALRGKWVSQRLKDVGRVFPCGLRDFAPPSPAHSVGDRTAADLGKHMETRTRGTRNEPGGRIPSWGVSARER